MYDQIKINSGLSRKFPMPESIKERAIAIILIGIAVLFACLFDPMRDKLLEINGESANAKLLSVQEYRKSGPNYNIGIYGFSDEMGSTYAVATKTIYDNKNKVPKQAKVAWQLGSPHKARILGEYSNRNIPNLIGFIILSFGVFLFFKSKKNNKE